MIFTVSVSMYACGRKTDNQKKESNSQPAETVSGGAISSSMEEIKDFSASISPVQKSETQFLLFMKRGSRLKYRQIEQMTFMR